MVPPSVFESGLEETDWLIGLEMLVRIRTLGGHIGLPCRGTDVQRLRKAGCVWGVWVANKLAGRQQVGRRVKARP